MNEASGISVGLSRCSRCPIWCADATHTQNLAKSDPATTPAPWTVQWHLKALKSARGLRRNRISPRSFPRDTCDNLRPNRPWRSPRVKNQAIELANSSHWRGRWNAPQSEARREPARSAPEGPARGCATSIRSKNLRMRSICVQIKILRFLGLTHIYARRAQKKRDLSVSLFELARAAGFEPATN